MFEKNRLTHFSSHAHIIFALISPVQTVQDAHHSYSAFCFQLLKKKQKTKTVLKSSLLSQTLSENYEQAKEVKERLRGFIDWGAGETCCCEKILVKKYICQTRRLSASGQRGSKHLCTELLEKNESKWQPRPFTQRQGCGGCRCVLQASRAHWLYNVTSVTPQSTV